MDGKIGRLGGTVKTAYVKYIAALLLFGSNGVVASFIHLNSYEIVFTRTLIGGAFLLAVFLLSKQKFTLWKNKKQFAYLVASGAAMGLNWVFLYEAYRQVGVSVATLACYCGPVIVMALSPVVFGERMTAAKAIGFAAVVAGMFLVNGDALGAGGVPSGLVYGILAAVMLALMVIFNKKAGDVPGLENAVCQLGVGCVVVTVFMLAANRGGFAIPRDSILPILVLGIVNTGVGCYLYFSPLKSLSAQTVSICGYLEPLSALVFSAVFLGERLAWVQVAGAALILGGAMLGEMYRGKKQAGRPAPSGKKTRAG